MDAKPHIGGENGLGGRVRSREPVDDGVFGGRVFGRGEGGEDGSFEWWVSGDFGARVERTAMVSAMSLGAGQGIDAGRPSGRGGMYDVLLARMTLP